MLAAHRCRRCSFQCQPPDNFSARNGCNRTDSRWVSAHPDRGQDSRRSGRSSCLPDIVVRGRKILLERIHGIKKLLSLGQIEELVYLLGRKSKMRDFEITSIRCASIPGVHCWIAKMRTQKLRHFMPRSEIHWSIKVTQGITPPVTRCPYGTATGTLCFSYRRSFLMSLR